MGDRCNIVVRQEKNSNRGDVWFYGHWSGSRFENDVREALAKKWRWTDYSYLSRIIFDVFTDGAHGDETGFGISTRMGDNEHPILVVDCPAQKVYMVPESLLEDGRLPKKIEGINIKTSFEMFIAQPAAVVK